MHNGFRAYSVHFLTALGAPIAMLALLAAAQGRWEVMFGWLILALVVDGIDGPLARRWKVASNAPRFDGVVLDLVIDFLTYVIIPTFALLRSGLLPDVWGMAALILIVGPSALYFADRQMKTEDASFNGFPSCWNMVALVIFALTPPPALSVAVIAILAAAMFLPVRFVHPVRTARWRPLILAAAIVWSASGALACLRGFPSDLLVLIPLVGSSLILTFTGLVQQAWPDRRAKTR